MDSTRKRAYEQSVFTKMIKYSAKIRHRPLHIYKDDTIYFITISTMNKTRYFNSDKKKDILLDVIHKACEKFLIQLSVWVVLDNHYHILGKIDKGEKVPQFINNINANSSRLLNILERCKGRRIWHQYFDRCIRNEKDYWARFNYVHYNCIKHGYAECMRDYKYSSYRLWLKDKGSEWMSDVFTNYPIVDFSAEGEV